MDLEPWRVHKSIRGLYISAWSGGRWLSSNLNSTPLHHLTKIFYQKDGFKVFVLGWLNILNLFKHVIFPEIAGTQTTQHN
jgi:hypothetical protein